MLCLSRLSLSLLMAVSYHITVTSPTDGDLSHKVSRKKVSMAETVMRMLLLCKIVVKIVYWGLTAVETLDVVYNHQTGNQSCSDVHPAYWVGTALAVAGCMIRIACYRALGRMFTFTFTVKPGHSLVTDGPYGVVRHPSYTGVFLCVVGIFIAHGSPGSWLRESGAITTLWGAPIVLFWSAAMMTVCVCLVFRMKDEDKIMKEMFGDEWVRWASQVRYLLVPGVY